MRRVAGRTAASCSSADSSPWSGTIAEIERARRVGEIFGAPPDFACTRQEHENVAVEALLRGSADGRRDLLAEVAVVGLRGEFDRDRKRAALGSDHRRVVEKRRDRFGVERRRHHDQLQLRAPRAELCDQREGEIAVEVALVELVDHHTADAAQLGIAEQPTGQHAFGDQLDPRARTDPSIEADLIADLVAQRTATLARDPHRRESRREPARLEHDDAAGDRAGIEECARHARGLAGAGWRDQHARPAVAHGGDQLWQDVVDRQREHAAS